MNRSGRTAGSQPKLCQVAGILRERTPAPALRRHLDRVWINELRGPAELEVVPDGCIDIYWTGSRLNVAGPNTQIVTATMPCAAILVGARFRRGIAARWLGVSAAELLNAHPFLEDIWSRSATVRLADELAHTDNADATAATLERALIDRLHQVAPVDPMMGATVAAAKARPGKRGVVRGLIDEFGWSERTLRRRCREAFGYGPKTLERILRFQGFLRLLANGRAPLSVLALEAGYADQAHLSREVRRLSGQSPGALIAELDLVGRFDQDAAAGLRQHQAPAGDRP
jgi:AraC-like DNA-binding protein